MHTKRGGKKPTQKKKKIEERKISTQKNINFSNFLMIIYFVLSLLCKKFFGFLHSNIKMYIMEREEKIIKKTNNCEARW